MDGAAAAETRAAAVEPPPQHGAGNQTRATTTQGNLVDEAARVATTLNEKLPTLSGEAQASGNHRNAAAEAARTQQAHDVVDDEAFDARASQPSAREEAAASVQEDSAERASATAEQGETRGRVRQRAAAVGASVGENLRPRVEKLREASTVVFDEATDDPGLRFVIVAASLFLLFLFILLFSYILG